VASDPIAWVAATDFKSIHARQQIRVAPLTILGGANSAGKSSIAQPLLLLKQTLDVSYDPGAILLDGANTRVTKASELVFGSSRSGVGGASFTVGIGFESGISVELTFNTGLKRRPVEVARMRVTDPDVEPSHFELRPNQPQAELERLTNPEILRWATSQKDEDAIRMEITSDRAFLNLTATVGEGRTRSRLVISTRAQRVAEKVLTDVLHLPGLRGNPERSYPRTASSKSFPGQFQEYVASIVAYWQEDRRADLQWVASQLERLGLTWKVTAKDVDDTRVELQVGRLPHARQGGAHDLVNIADVGLGVSQVLPVLVALRSAVPGQVVLVEQPEIHLHPRAQTLLADPTAEAAARGVRVVVETHSSLLIRAFQTLIARDELDHKSVVMHWFRRDPLSGATTVESVEPDHTGAVGDWPIDFDDVLLMTEGAYLDAVASRNA
jgi:hypothetical protein